MISQSGTSAKYPSGLSLIPLINNGDGSWTGNMGGMALRFSNFMYEVFYDVNGNPVAPTPGDAVWPQSIGPEPGVTTLQQFNCLQIISFPNSPENQFTVQNHCTYQGSYYVQGAGFNAYIQANYDVWNHYQSQVTAYYTLIAAGLPATVPPVPNSPLITPYLIQDYQEASGAVGISSARFAVYSYSPSEGIVFGIDAR